MAGQITALRFQKRNKDRVNVYIDDEFAFGLAAIEAARLKVGQTLDDEEIVQLKWKDQIERAYERALNLLSYRPRSKTEIRRRLRRKDIAGEAIDEVIRRLKRAGLVDDREFARYWVRNRTQFNPKGVYALRQELRQKGVASVVIDEALADFDEASAVRDAVEAGARRLAYNEPQDFRRKLTAYLARRGFSYALIKPLVEEKMEELYSEEPS